MKVMVLVKASAASEAGMPPSETLMTEMTAYNEALDKAGILLAGEGLKPSSDGVRVEFSGTQRHITQGPFGDPANLVAGYWIWQVTSMDEAVDWLQRCPNPHNDDSVVEIRPIYGIEDFCGAKLEDAAWTA